MVEEEQPTRFCLSCGAENAGSAATCGRCGLELRDSPMLLQRRRGIAFLLNELEVLRAEGAVSQAVYVRLHRRYRAALASAEQDWAEQQVSAPAKAPAMPAAAPTRRPVQEKEGPGWLAEQQANLLLYLGAFLIVIAMLIYVSSSGEAIGGGVRMALMVVYTLLFMGAGVLCMRFPRVQQAGVVFFAVAALMVPLNFVGAYYFLLSDQDVNPTGLWLAGSLTSAGFYGAVSFLGFGRWYPVPTVLALASALGSVLALVDAPPEAYPGSYIALALLFVAPSLVSLGGVSEHFGGVGRWAGHIIVPLATLVAIMMAVGAAAGDPNTDRDLATRWYLPPTVAIAALFYWTQALWTRRMRDDIEALVTVVALALTGAVALTLVFAFDAGRQWYGPVALVVGWLYAAGSEGFGPRWFGQPCLGWMALATITGSWLLQEGVYADFPRYGAGVHFAAVVFYLCAARLVTVDVPLFERSALGQQQSQEAEYYRMPAAVPFVYAAGLTLSIGFFHLLASLPAAEGAGASDLGWPYFGLSVAVAVVAATMRWWWDDMRVHVYAIALGLSLFTLFTSADVQGQVALLLALFTGVALALTLWEREPLALPVSAAFGFLALLAAWRHFEPNDAYLPLALSGVGYGLFGAYAALRNREEDWAQIVQVLAIGYVVLAPIVGWMRLSIAADPEGLVGGQRFEETLVYQTSAASVLLVAVLLLAVWWVMRSVELAVAASAVAMVALLLEVGHFRPDNVQAYTAPLGIYVLGGALLASRLRELSEETQPVIGSLELAGAALIMGPSLVESFDSDGWAYGLILLAEGLGFVALAIIYRRLWLLGTAITFVVLDGLHYLFFAGGPPLPNWAVLAIAGTGVMGAGVAILLGRDRWTDWQRRVLAWWNREPATTAAA